MLVTEMFLLILATTFLSTFAGGMVALKNSDRLHRILGFTAGVLLGVVAFDILPEIFRLSSASKLQPEPAMIALVVGFLMFHIAEKLTIIHHVHELEYGDHHHPRVGILSALALSGHSFLDGVGIGLAFQVNPGVGLAVGIAVISHDFADGLNTASLMLANHNTRRRTVALVVLDAAAPILGAASTWLFKLSDPYLLLYLGFFAGFLLYIGASDILPEAHSHHSSTGTIALTVLGAAFIYLVTRVSF